jgi:hypothetical protein
MKWELVGVNQSGSNSSPKKQKNADLQEKRYSHFSRAPTPTFELLPLPPHPLLKGWEWSESNPEVAVGAHEKPEERNESNDYIYASHK